ncbi:MAG TPA: MFS transporter [Holophaga sp.]|nr:MFS transporter [Holophaga sp.]
MRPTFDNISKSYAYSFLFSLAFTEAIWMLYLAYRGMSLVQIGLLESIFHLTSLAMEVPTGILADRLGRRTSRVLSRAVALVASVLMILGRTFPGFAIAFVLSALSYNLESGAGDALVYDSLVDAGREQDYMKVKGRLEIAFQGARGLALVAGGFLATISYELAYGLTAAVHGLAMVTALTFVEPRAGKADRKAGTGWLPALAAHCRESLQVFRANRRILSHILFIETFSLFYATLYFYFQNFLKAQGYRESGIGVILALSATGGVLAATQTHRIEQGLGRLWLVRLAPAAAIAAFAGIAFTRLEPVFMVLLAMIEGMLFVSFSDYINRMIPSGSRATLLSLQAMVYSVMMIFFFPLVGALAQSRGFKTAFAVIFAAAVLVLVGAQQLLLRSLKGAEEPARPGPG